MMAYLCFLAHWTPRVNEEEKKNRFENDLNALTKHSTTQIQQDQI